MDFSLAFKEINYVTVLVAAIAHYGIGWLWYSPTMFAREWLADMGFTSADMSGGNSMQSTMILSFVAHLVLIAFLAALIGSTATFQSGVNMGLFVGIGLVGASAAIHHLYSRKPWRLFWINTGYSLVGLVVAGAIIGIWG